MRLERKATELIYVCFTPHTIHLRSSFEILPRRLNARSHLASVDLNRSHDGVRQGLTMVSPEILADNDSHSFSHLDLCDGAHDR